MGAWSLQLVREERTELQHLRRVLAVLRRRVSAGPYSAGPYSAASSFILLRRAIQWIRLSSLQLVHAQRKGMRHVRRVLAALQLSGHRWQ